MKCKLIEYQPELGGKLRIYPEKMIWDVGGLKPVTGAQLIEQLVGQGLTFQPEVCLNEKIVSLSHRKEDGLFILKAASGQSHFSKTVILTIGSGILNPQKLNIEGAERFEVSNLNYTVSSLTGFKDRVVVISGGGNSAIDWANELEPIAKKVYLVHRKDHLTGHESQITQIKKSSIKCYFQTAITQLMAGESRDTIERIELTHLKTGETIELDVDEVIVNHGFDQDATLLNDSKLDIQLADQFFVKGTSKCETSVPGLFAAGDILQYEGKVNLIAGTFQDAANAVNQAKQFIDPHAEAFAMVSSHNEVFKERNKEWVRKAVIDD